MAWAIKGSFGEQGTGIGQWSTATLLRGIVVKDNIIYINSGGNRKTIYRFDGINFTFLDESSTTIYSAVVMGDGSIQGGILVARDNWAPTLRRIQLSNWAITHSRNVTGTHICSDDTNTYMDSGTNVIKYRNTDLQQITTFATAINNASIAIDTDNLYVVGSTLCKVFSKSTLTQIDSFAVATQLGGSNAGQACEYNGYLFAGNINGTVNVYSLATKTLYSTIPIPPQASGQNASTVFADADGVYVSYETVYKVVVFNNDIAPPPTVVPVSGGPNIKRRPYPYNGNMISNGGW